MFNALGARDDLAGQIAKEASKTSTVNIRKRLEVYRTAGALLFPACDELMRVLVRLQLEESHLAEHRRFKSLEKRVDSLYTGFASKVGLHMASQICALLLVQQKQSHKVGVLSIACSPAPLCSSSHTPPCCVSCRSCRVP